MEAGDPTPVESMQKDIEVLRELMMKRGLNLFKSMVDIASSTCMCREAFQQLICSKPSADTAPPTVVQAPDSAVSSSRSTRSMATSASLPSTSGTASSASFYTDSIASSRPPPSLRTVPTAPSQRSGSPTPTEDDGAVARSTEVKAKVEPDDEPATCSGALSKKGDNLRCPFCAEMGIDMRIGRKPDLRRHFVNFHGTNHFWLCQLTFSGGCGMGFDLKAAYEAHVRQLHGGVKFSDAKVNLCQQVVFACGFESCREVFEADTDAQGPTMQKDYMAHVLAHLVQGPPSPWSYSRRMRNLLRQRLTKELWAPWDRNYLVWDPQSSKTLQKMLECRHLVDAATLCKYAALSGSKPSAPPVPPPGFGVPLLNTCADACHNARADKRFSLPFVRPLPSSKSHHLLHGIAGHMAPKALRSVPSTSTLSSFASNPGTLYHNPASSQASLPDFDVPGQPLTGFLIDNHHVHHHNPTCEPGLLQASQHPQHDHDGLSHPLQLFSGYEALGELPSQEQVVGDRGDSVLPLLEAVQQRVPEGTRAYHSYLRGDDYARHRRTPSPDDCRMQDPPTLPPQQLPEHHESFATAMAPLMPGQETPHEFYNHQVHY